MVTIFVLSDTELKEDYKFSLQGIYGMKEGFIQIQPPKDIPVSETLLLKDGSVVTGENPVLMEDIIDRGKALVSDFEQSISRLKSILIRVDEGEGTLGKLISDDTLYDEAVAFVREIKTRPWRLMKRDKKLSVDEEKAEEMRTLK